MWQYFASNFLIGLREGLEATLIVSILVAFLVRTNRRERLPLVWLGVGAAILLSVVFGALLTFTSTSLLSTFEQQETFGGSMSIVAVAFVTWMIFWMRRTARHLKADLTGKLEAALSMGAVAVAFAAFLSVAREGLETTLFFWTAVQSAGTTSGPLAGFSTGIAVAIVLGVGLYLSAVRLNLSTFFTWTGAGLVLVAAGVLAYGVHDLQEAGVLAGLNTLAFDVSSVIPPTSWYGTLLKGVLNFSPATTVFQAVVWVLYTAAIFTVFFWPAHKPAATPSRATAATSA
ncbi:MAG: high-affinity iron transporter [Cryptosporangiaceae bacterium]|nr:high-affinity iron transporter [Cryptosporangiaceae bacterium]